MVVACLHLRICGRWSRSGTYRILGKVAEGMHVEDALDDFQNEYFENRVSSWRWHHRFTVKKGEEYLNYLMQMLNGN